MKRFSMSLPETKQVASVLDRSSAVLLLVPEKPSADAFSSMMALSLALQKQNGKEIHAVSPSHVPSELQFLPGSSQVKMHPQMRPSIIVDMAGIGSVAEVRKEELRGGMRIHLLLPEGAEVTAELVETHVRQLPYDCIVVLGASDLMEIGHLFSDHADFFYNTPVINIDNRPTNEHFGTINIVDITASSIAEITHELIEAIRPGVIDEDIATALYAGIVSATESFQKPSTTPHAFQISAELMGHHARTDIVIGQLVKTKPLNLLKLAGRTYARLRHDEHGQLFWSILRTQDYQESNASEEDIPAVMRELTNNISGYNAAFIIFENAEKQYTVYLSLGKGLGKRMKEVQEQLTAKKEGSLMIFPLNADSLTSAEESALQEVRRILPIPHT
jgi:nanoRNase/pAp phosphatase (c-di-AMP/oligoRNAs hydrolase)